MAGRRVFVGPYDVAGYYTHLERALREIGVDAEFIDLAGHPFEYGAPRPLRPLVRWTRWAARHRLAATGPRRIAWRAVEGACRLALFAWAAARFDAFIFGFAATILGAPAFELRVLRLLGRRVICVFHGSDSRPAYMDGSLMAPDRGRTVDDCVRLTAATKARVRVIDRYADWVVDNPLSAQLHERRCVLWFAIGVPYPERDRSAADDPVGPRSAVRILHSPSHPEAKGTSRIVEAVDRLRANGHAIDFVQITGRSNAEVLREIALCDFVVDQLYSDTPMAGFAAEAAHLGKPAVVGGYGARAFAQFIPDEMTPPSEYCHPDEIERAIERLVVDARYRRALGERARSFVRTRWSPTRVAGRYLRLLDGDVPADWQFDPRDVDYVRGCALPEERARFWTAAVLERGGAHALGVADKPAFAARVIEFARGRPAEAMAPGC